MLGRRTTSCLVLTISFRQIYLSEIVEVRRRGMVGATPTLMLSLGTLLIYTLGTFLPWRSVSWVAATPPAFLIIGMFFMPESPSWLLMKGRYKEAELALKRVRPVGHDVAGELQNIGSGSASRTDTISLREKLRDFRSPEVWKPSVIMAVIFFTQQFCGGLVMLFYSAKIFASMPGGPDKYQATILAGAARFIFTLAATLLLRKVGVRPLLLISGIGMAASMFTTGTYSFVDEMYDHTLAARWVPAVGIVSFVVFFTPGFGTVSWVLLGELFPLRLRGTLSCLLSFTCHVFVFLAVKTFPVLLEALGSSGVYWFYGSVSVVGTIFVYFSLPETKGISLATIEDHFRTSGFWRLPSCAGGKKEHFMQDNLRVSLQSATAKV